MGNIIIILCAALCFTLHMPTKSNLVYIYTQLNRRYTGLTNGASWCIWGKVWRLILHGLCFASCMHYNI